MDGHAAAKLPTTFCAKAPSAAALGVSVSPGTPSSEASRQAAAQCVHCLQYASSLAPEGSPGSLTAADMRTVVLRGEIRQRLGATCRFAQGGYVSALGAALAVVGARLVQEGALPGQC